MMTAIHPQDKQALAELRFSVQKLIADRVAEHGHDGMGPKNGHSPNFMRIPWDQDRRTEDWHWSTLYGLVDGAGGSVSVRVANVPEVGSALFEMGLTNPVFLGVGLIDLFKKTREHLGITQVHAADLLGLRKSSVWKLEGSDDPKVVTPMRLFRALGGFVRYEVVR